MTVDQAREIVSMAQRRPWEGDSTTVHLTAAHLVRDDSWNALLKVLEEPPPYFHAHLYAPSTDSIPRTIKSRSHVIRESLPVVHPEDAARLLRLIESGDALAILREADRHTEPDATKRVLESLWTYAIQIGKTDAGLLSDYWLAQLRLGASPRIVMKALLLELAIRHRKTALQ
jgi:DNA polymerase III delta prime subunit